MIFEMHKLEAPIDKFIEKIFYYKDCNPEHCVERVIPTGNIFIAFELEGKSGNVCDNTSLKPIRTFTNVWVSGMHKNYFTISPHQKSEILVIQFKPFGGFPFLHLSIDKLNDKIFHADEIFGMEILKLRKKIMVKRTVFEKFIIIESWLNERFDKNKVPDSELISIVSQFITKPVTDHKAIVHSYSKSQKDLIYQFKKFCGLTPKVLHRIYRFNEVLNKTKTEELVSWAQIAYQLGYADQSHFIKEFKEFSGFSPMEFISLEYNKIESNFFPINK